MLGESIREELTKKRLAVKKKNVKDSCEIRALKILSTAFNNESSWPIFIYLFLCMLILSTVVGMLTR